MWRVPFNGLRVQPRGSACHEPSSAFCIAWRTSLLTPTCRYVNHLPDYIYTISLQNVDKCGRYCSQAAFRFSPDFIFYNAGTDVLSGDALGRLGVTPEGVVTRDEMVFDFALKVRLNALLSAFSLHRLCFCVGMFSTVSSH